MAGADAVGLVGAMPTGPGVITDDTARTIARTVPPPVMPWLLTSKASAPAIIAHAKAIGVAAVQIVRHVPPSVHDEMAALAPALRRIQVIHVEDESAVDVLSSYGTRPDAFLLDSGRPSTEELGGTGRRHDWRVSAICVSAAPRPVFLAGGLGPDNAREAIDAVRPFGLDICSGLRTNDQLNAEQLERFMAAVRA